MNAQKHSHLRMLLMHMSESLHRHHRGITKLLSLSKMTTNNTQELQLHACNTHSKCVLSSVFFTISCSSHFRIFSTFIASIFLAAAFELIARETPTCETAGGIFLIVSFGVVFLTLPSTICIVVVVVVNVVVVVGGGGGGGAAVVQKRPIPANKHNACSIKSGIKTRSNVSYTQLSATCSGRYTPLYSSLFMSNLLYPSDRRKNGYISGLQVASKRKICPSKESQSGQRTRDHSPHRPTDHNLR